MRCPTAQLNQGWASAHDHNDAKLTMPLIPHLT
jgi:hypothetical protein